MEFVFDIVTYFAVDPSEKSIEIMRKFSEQFCRKSGTYFCVDKSVTAVVIKVIFSLYVLTFLPGLFRLKQECVSLVLLSF